MGFLDLHGLMLIIHFERVNDIFTVIHSIDAAGAISWLGIKLGWLKSVEGTIPQRTAMIGAALDALDEISGN
jgi:hypothetical protein